MAPHAARFRTGVFSLRDANAAVSGRAVLALVPAATCAAAEIYSTDFAFPAYVSGNLNGQVAWNGVGGSWALSGSVNSPFTAGSVIGTGVAPGVDPVGGTGQMVRLVSERFSAGRTRGYLDLANSGKWAAASADGHTVLETRIALLVPSGQPVQSGWGITVSHNAFATAGGFLVSSQDGSVVVLNGGYAPSNRIAVGASVPLNQWNEFVYRWDAATGEASLAVNGEHLFSHTTSAVGSPFAASLFATTDSAPGPASSFGYFDDFRISAELPAAPCPADIDSDGTVGGPDLTALLAAWSSQSDEADLNGDRQVNGADLAVLLAAWGACTS
jgi:hypothetical protein